MATDAQPPVARVAAPARRTDVDGAAGAACAAGVAGAAGAGAAGAAASNVNANASGATDTNVSNELEELHDVTFDLEARLQEQHQLVSSLQQELRSTRRIVFIESSRNPFVFVLAESDGTMQCR